MTDQLDSDRRRVSNRLRRARGQLDAVIDAVDGGRPCRDVITQLAAVSSALDRAGDPNIARAMRGGVAAPHGGNRDDDLTREDHEKLFLSLS